MDGIVVVVVRVYCESQLKIFSHFSAAEGCHLEAAAMSRTRNVSIFVISTAMTAIPVGVPGSC